MGDKLSPILFVPYLTWCFYLMNFKIIPQHVAIIMDGNGRWAQTRRLPRTQGHIEGVKRVEEIVYSAHRRGIQVLTLYTFSTENWNRPAQEVSMLMRTLINVIKHKIKKLDQDNFCVRFIGRQEGVPPEVIRTMQEATQQTRNNSGLILNIAFNYGGRQEILDATQAIVSAVKNNKLKPSDLNDKIFSQYLYTNGLPDPDLLIRTSGERRISNFLLWQLSYAELYFTDKFWPDFNEAEFEKALLDFQARERRYGNVAAAGRK